MANASPTCTMWHSLDIDTVVLRQATSLSSGLGIEEVQRRQLLYGPNEVDVAVPRKLWGLLRRQFSGPLVAILVVAAGLSIAIGEALEAAAIAAIVVVNGLLGFAQQWRADRALEALQALFVQRARVRRGGRTLVIGAFELVPGDVIELEAGDRVPADARVAEANGLRLDESVLTGESAPVWKSTDPVEASAGVAERSSVAHLGTQVAAGHGLGVVIATGRGTEFGMVVDLTSTAEQSEPPLQKSLRKLSRFLGAVAVSIATATVLLGIALGRPAEDMFLMGVSLAVAVVPEGLPAVVTVTLALGARAMSRRRALLRNLEAAETLGAASVICADKTGTLTENRMTVREVWTAEGQRSTDELRTPVGVAMQQLLETAQVCNNATLGPDGDTLDAVGDPTEVALLVLAWALGQPRSARQVLREVPFDSVSKIMTVVSRDDSGDIVAHAKGAPEVVLERCTALLGPDGLIPVDAGLRRSVGDSMERMAGDGLRLLGLARRTLRSEEDGVDHDLVLLGFVGMHDPPREEVPAAVASAAAAGIDVVVMTGDAPETALAIARQVGLPATATITGAELDRLEDEEALARLDGSHVLARVTPANKMRMVRLLQGRGEVVAMTGDGVNDAPALEQASVGIAMGERGTDVARGSADVVLADDNFASIVAAIEEGRRQHANIGKFVAYLLSANLGEVIAVSGAVALGWPLILLPAQILWMNLVTDGVTALTLGIERAEPDIMARPPRPHDEPILTRRRLWQIGSLGLLIGLASMVVFKASLGSGDPASLMRAQTLAFTAMVLLETVNVLNFRSERESLLTIGLTTNRWLLAALVGSVVLQWAAVHLPGLSRGMGTVGLTWSDWLILVLVALPVLGLGELAKWAMRRAEA